jgi:hypothetical protein
MHSANGSIITGKVTVLFITAHSLNGQQLGALCIQISSAFSSVTCNLLSASSLAQADKLTFTT